MRSLLRLLFMLLQHSCGQFGNVHVDWDMNNNPHVATPDSVPTRDFVAPENGRRTELSIQSVSALVDILAGLSVACPNCMKRSHYVSKIRSACIALGPKALKAQLAKRGLRCDSCTMREHYLDRVLDTVHLAPKG